MKYAIQSKYGAGYTAGPKAVNDATSILKKEGYQVYYINKIRCDFNWIPAAIGALFDIVRICIFCLKLKNEDSVLIQWPLYSSSASIELLITLLRSKHLDRTVLIHDIQNLRLQESVEDSIFNNYINDSDIVIVHSIRMKEYLEGIGCTPKCIRILTSFDYLTHDVCPQRTYSKDIVYAGNLQKSQFLNNIDKELLSKVNFNCYGIGGETLKNGFNYKGCFKAENVSVLQGSWGLVWDGDSIETCSGMYGNYLRYNSPHKISLYIVSGLPLIVWKQSSLASYVENNKLGITIESLKDLSQTLSSITPTVYEEYSRNIRRESEMLRKGAHLLSCLK